MIDLKDESGDRLRLKRALIALEKMQAKLNTLENTQTDPIAIVGIGCRFPGGANNPQAFWQLLQNGGDAVREVPADRWKLEDYYDADPDAPGKTYVCHGAFLDEVATFDPQFFGIAPREAAHMDPQQRLLLEVSWEALENAGIPPHSLVNSKTGVYVGLMNNDYMRFEVGEIDANNFDYYGDTGDVGLLAGRLSYVLGLQGPSMVVTTACSSSLVATHLACQALRSGECDLALAGGVNLIFSPDGNIVFAKLRAMAHDGRCKTFDASADGYGRGEGCGVVVLKRLADAQAAGDPILGLIRGTAVNHNGPSGSLTIPNGVAQSNLIRTALKMGNIDPNTVSYVETHGTGTRLGDPIEVRALGRAFGQKRPADQPLWIGSVKTNIGHLEAAAGVAGLIKTVLALQHRHIPPHLHFSEPNPEIPWAELPLAVPTQLTPWPEGDVPRVAGVSAFGMSGINAHIVVEEAPVTKTDVSRDERPFHLLTLSAKTEIDLAKATENLAGYLKQHPEVNLADVAHTLQVGRTAFNHRRALICTHSATAINALETIDPQHVLEHTLLQEQERPVTFMFPGLGDQYAHVAAQLYQHEPVFRQQLDRCCDLLLPHLNVDLRQLLYAAETAPAANGSSGLDLRQMVQRSSTNGKNGHIKLSPLAQTALAQPLLFALEYALAQLWLSWGIQPQALIGYSLGEYVAACLSGVFSLEDGLRLVAQRAQLIDSLPAGSMLAVALPEAEMTHFLSEGLSLAGINGPLMCVVSGAATAVTALAQQLNSEGIACRPLQTTHAFHSSMMAPIVPAFRQLLQTVTFKPPQLPYISNLTGTWATAVEVTHPDYWINHLQRPVRFADGVQTLWQKPGNVLLEVGVGQTLGSLALQHPARSQVTDPVVVSSLPTAHAKQDDVEFMLRSLAQMWLAGVPVDWHGVANRGDKARRPRRYLALPTYPFHRRRYWVQGATPTPKSSLQTAASRTPTQPFKKPDIADWFSVPTWQRLPLAQAQAQLQARRRWLFFMDDEGLGEALVAHLRGHGHEVILIRPGAAFERMTDDSYVINPQTAADYAALMKHLFLINKVPEQIVHLWNVTAVTPIPLSLSTAEQALQTGFFSLLFLAQALGNQFLNNPLRVYVISNNMQDVLGGEGVHPQKATLLGLVKTMPQEYEQIYCTSIDVALPTPIATLVPQLLTEMTTETAVATVAYRGASRWVSTFAPIRLQEQDSGLANLKSGGVYLITGGFGGLGAALAERLAQQVQARLVIVGRTPIPPRESWPALLADDATPSNIRQRLEQVQMLEAHGAEVIAVVADVADKAQMQLALDMVHERFGAINGLFHVAGLPGEGLMQLKEVADAAQVLRPKVQGTLVLDELLQDEPLDFMVLYSSIVVAMSGLGEVDYCAANAFLDAFAHHRRQRGQTAVAINWGMWQWNDWQSSLAQTMPDVYAKMAESRQQYGFTFDEGVDALWRIMASPLPQVLVSSLDLETAATLWHALTYEGTMQRMEKAEEKPTHPRPNLRTPYVAPRDLLEQKIAAVWAQCLGVEKVGVHDRFQELGGNSLLGIAIISRLKEALDVQLTAASLYEGPTVRALYELICADNVQSDPMLDSIQARGKQRKRGGKRRQRI